MARSMSSLHVAVLVGAALYAMPVQAQLARTFVSSLGDDANNCGRLAPCRTFQRAHDATLAAGEITVLDAGAYGAVTVLILHLSVVMPPEWGTKEIAGA